MMKMPVSTYLEMFIDSDRSQPPSDEPLLCLCYDDTGHHWQICYFEKYDTEFYDREVNKVKASVVYWAQLSDADYVFSVLNPGFQVARTGKE